MRIWSAFVLTSFLAGCSNAVHPVAGAEGVSTATVLGYAVFDVDPMAPPDARIRIRTESVSTETVRETTVPKSQSSVLSSVVLSGTGVWNANTERLSATVRIANATSNDLDEPAMILDWLSRSEVTGELVHEGDGGLGSLWAFADIARAGGANDGSARQRIRFHAPGGVAFSFRVQVIADPAPRRAIDPDNDDDGYNGERDEPAGDDCDDSDPTVYPGHGACECLSSCNACVEGQCCAEACSGTCACPLGCACDYESTWSGDAPEVICADASCDLICKSYGNPCTISGCEGSTCDLVCESGSAECTVESCTDSTCATHCARTSGDCKVNTCADGAECEVECNKASGSCGVAECEGSSCALACSRFGGQCFIDRCEGSVCSVSCEYTSGSCGIHRCEAGSTCSLSCDSSTSCAMTCAADASCTMACPQGGDCALTCEGGSPIDCGGGVEVCPGTSCP